MFGQQSSVKRCFSQAIATAVPQDLIGRFCRCRFASSGCASEHVDTDQAQAGERTETTRCSDGLARSKCGSRATLLKSGARSGCAIASSSRKALRSPTLADAAAAPRRRRVSIRSASICWSSTTPAHDAHGADPWSAPTDCCARKSRPRTADSTAPANSTSAACSRAVQTCNSWSLAAPACSRPIATSARVELLWHGIWSYVRQHDLDVMIGCASLEGTDPHALALPLSFLHHFARAPEGWQASGAARSAAST